ncbi:sensor histidine kinase [Fulvivirga ulvae]|uniref:sensor histidine kinase n=1 Tax=Fulvivirga ulvae TaxID=2904245 RepID=UPI00272EC677|nr:ATP-binding protein [Fulvivirga ulvae]
MITLSAVALTYGQPRETGRPFISNFTPKEYNANTQNWSIVEDPRGVMYFGNNKGVLEYDGVSWRLIPVNNRSIVRSLAINDKGVIFVGAVGEFGYLAPDKSGNMVYNSLTHLLPDQAISFSDIWTTLVRGDEVYFQSFNVLFRYKDGKIKSWALSNAYHRSFLVDNELYLRLDDTGLMMLKGDTLIPLKGGSFFASEFISAMLPFENKILIGSRNHGLFLYNTEEGTLKKFETEVDDLLKDSKIYHGTILRDGNIALGTLKEGLVVINKAGKLILHLDETKGLQYQIVYNLFSDSYGFLWMALANGISKVEVISPFTIFDQVSGLNGGILAINRHKGRLYVSTHQSVFFLNEEDKFEQISNVDIQCWELTKFNSTSYPGDQKLLLTASDGVYEIHGDVANKIFNARVGAVGSTPLYPNRLFIGMIGKIVSLNYSSGKWKKEGEIKMPQEEIRSIKPDSNGNIWIGTLYGGAFRLNAHDWQAYLDGQKVAIIKGYGLNEGLPTLNWNYFFNVNNEVLVTTRKGIYLYNEKKDEFEKHPEIDAALRYKERWIYYINKDEKGNLWFDSDQGKGMLVENNGKYTLYENPFKRVIVSPENQVTGYTDKNGILWFGTPDGLFRYDSKYNLDYKQSFDVLIRRVKIGDDSTVFKGTYYSETSGSPDLGKRLVSSRQPSSLVPELEYVHNSVSFQFAATAFEHESGNLYSYKLDGYDDKWSAWTKETKKEYTNLQEGQYTFRVKAKNFYDVVSEESVFSFSILSPWHRTPLAYIIYVLTGIGCMYLLVSRYSKKLKRDNLRLEAMVNTRTAEINDQKEQIEKQKNEVEKSYKNVTTLSQIGQNITSTLDLKSIINTLHKSINSLMDASSFGVGIYNESTKSLDFQYAYESGEELPFFSHSLHDDDKMAVWCFNNCKEVFINNLSKEYTNYIQALNKAPTAGKAHSESIIYIPLWIKDKMLGVITVQSFRKNAYKSFHLDILRTLAAYTAIALDNSYAYLRLNEINEELSSTLENLKQTQTQLVQSEKMASLGQLTAGVAHEINNPINFVSAGIDSLTANYEDLNLIIKKYNQLAPEADNTELFREIEKLKKELDMDYLLEEIPELLNSVKSGANRTTEIIKSLRNFTRLDEDQLKKANINEGLDSTLVILRNQMTNKIEVIREYGDLQPINCYPGQLNQVFMNILNNAIQAIDNEGRICIQTTQNEDSAIVKIKDSGRGMSEDLKKRIFDPFFTTKDVGEGTGLGLSISYGIIEKHHGKIEVNSTAGEGTEFIIELPLNLN